MLDAAGCADGVRTSVARMRGFLRAHPYAPVSRYPGHDVRDVVGHVWEIHNWVLRNLIERPAARPDRPPPDPGWSLDDLDGAFATTAAALADTLERMDPETPVWTFGVPPTARFWQGRMLHETEMHRWDVEAAATYDPMPIPTEIAVSGLAEGLAVHMVRPLAGSDVGGKGERLLLAPTDDETAWVVTLQADGIEVAPASPTGVDAEASARGPAADLWLYATGRVGRSHLDAIDIAGVLDRFERALAGIPAALR